MFRSEEHTSELQSLRHLVCRLLLEKKKKILAKPLSPIDDVVCPVARRSAQARASRGGPGTGRRMYAAWHPPRELVVCFFFNDTATTEIYTLSLHDALPICRPPSLWVADLFEANLVAAN